jgi:hypothetical protein
MLGSTSQLASQVGEGEAVSDGGVAWGGLASGRTASKANSVTAVIAAATRPFRMARRWMGSTPTRR